LTYGNRLPTNKIAMRVLVLKNIETEGPGTIGDYLEENSWGRDVVELEKGELPPPVEDYHSVLVMGGPMGLYEADDYPFLRNGFRAVEEALKAGKKVLGVCLGAQVMAQVLGARVYKGHAKEVGWLDITLTGEGLEDTAMRAMAEGPAGEGPSESFKVFHWHGDTFDLPEGATRLAGSELYENQAFSYGGGSYALQFHVEVTPEMLEEWFRGEPERERVMADTARYHGECDARARNFYEKFFTT
jgi:GMP synthase (glutamine-hydrolysing)